MTRDWTEETLSEKPAVALLEILGYSFVPELGAERETPRTAMIATRLLAAIKRLNPWISSDNAARVLRDVMNPNVSSLLEANEYLYTLITRGKSVSQDIGGILGHTVRLIDFENIKRNEFVVTRQFRVQGAERSIEFDVVVFVNGLPLAVIECKHPASRSAMEDAIGQLERYQEQGDKFRNLGAPQAFYAVQFLIAISREKAKYAAVGNDARLWAGFPEAFPGGVAALQSLLGREATTQDKLLFSLLEPSNLLEFVRLFVVFEPERGKVVKKLARYQQRIAVRKSLERVQRGEGGVIWHTQGSGKSLTMVWLAQALRMPHLGLGNPTLLVVTDRLDLDKQIFATFDRVGLSLPVRAKNKRELKTLLEIETGVTVMTTVQKFVESSTGRALNQNRVIVLVDEAHRSQYGPIAAMMRRSLPNALFIGFTGTPIDKRDRSTKREFGDYIHQYSLQQAVQDEATVPIYYTGRELEDLKIEGRSLDALYDRALTEYTPNERERIKAKFSKFEVVAGAPSRIREIASDIMEHFDSHLLENGFKAQLVAVNRHAAVEYQENFERFLWHETVVIFTGAEQDDERLKKHHRSKAQQDTLIKRFKNPTDPLKMLIVVDMLLTGFDAPIEQALYLDAPLKEHTLLQAIARVNRPFEGKTHGLIVDYWGVTDHLQEALKNFENEDVSHALLDISTAISRLEQHYRGVLRFFPGVDVHDLEAHLKRLEDSSERDDFFAALRLFSASMNTVLPNQKALGFLPDLKRFLLVRDTAKARFERETKPDWSDIAAKVRALIESNVSAGGVQEIVAPVSILSADFDQQLAKLASPDAQASEMAHAAHFETIVHLREDPVFYGSLKARLEEIIKARLENRLSAAEQFKQLVPIVEELRQGASRKAQNLGISETALAFHAALDQAGADTKTPFAEGIEEIIKKLRVIDWIKKDDIQREIRREIRRELRQTKLEKHQLEALLNDLLEIARARLA